MSVNWGNLIVATLSACTAGVAIVEFYGGKELNGQIKTKLEEWWIRMSYLRWPTIGLAEAKFSLRLFEFVAGRSASWHRFAAILTFFVASCGASYVFSRIVFPTDKPTFLPVPMDGGLLYAALGTLISFVHIAISLWLTHRITRASISWADGKRFSSLWFLGFLLLTVTASYFLSLLIGWLYMESPYLTGHVFGWNAFHTFSVIAHVGFHSVLLGIGLSLMRFALLAAFILTVISGWTLAWLKATIFRLTEAEKGALTVFSLALTAVAAGLKWWLKEMA